MRSNEPAVRLRLALAAAVALPVVLTAVPIASAEDVWVSAIHADLRDDPGPFGSVVDTVKKGDQLSVLEHQDPWLKVQNPADNKQGYVTQDALSAQKVNTSGDQLGAMFGTSGASAGGSSAAGKGLEPMAADYGKTHNLDVQGSLDQLKALHALVKPADYKTFCADGKVGPNKPKA